MNALARPLVADRWSSLSAPCAVLTVFTVLAALALVAGCATTSTVNPGAPTPPPPRPGVIEPPPTTAPPRTAPAPVPSSPLLSEQRFLDDWFRGTPVSIAMADANTLAIDVPLANSFAAGSSAVKPALAAVLNRVATSLRRQPAMRVSIAAPSDANAGVALASSRAQQVRDHLVSRGVAASRMAGVGTARTGAPVQLRLVIAPQAIGRLDDATLPVPTMGVKPVAASSASGSKR